MKIFFRFLTLVCAFAFAFVELAAQNVDEGNGGASKNIVGGESDGATPAGRKALLISVSEYVIDESVPPLPGAANDVAAVFERLLKVGFKPEDITVLREPGGGAPSRRKITGICRRASPSRIGSKGFLAVCGRTISR